MEQRKLISTTEFCTIHNVEVSFLQSLEETGLIEIQTIEDIGFIPISQLPELERMVRLHNELDINMEGIDTINHLLNRIMEMQHEMMLLRNRLRFFERDFTE
ncbi:MAG: chaperone modulator CbpM [Methylococcaceae bacterium]|nr:chaperone modulator CbpM [Prolixibacteraceae bacterium]